MLWRGKELESWKDNSVYERVENQNKKCISVCLLYSIKQTDKGSKPKARLVARGLRKNHELHQKTLWKHCCQTLLPITGISSHKKVC